MVQSVCQEDTESLFLLYVVDGFFLHPLHSPSILGQGVFFVISEVSVIITITDIFLPLGGRFTEIFGIGRKQCLRTFWFCERIFRLKFLKRDGLFLLKTRLSFAEKLLVFLQCQKSVRSISSVIANVLTDVFEEIGLFEKEKLSKTAMLTALGGRRIAFVWGLEERKHGDVMCSFEYLWHGLEKFW